MRRGSRPEWMRPEDEHVLALLGDGRRKALTSLAGQLPLSRERLAARCLALATHGLITHLGGDIYTISEDGRKYLDGELDLLAEEQ